MCTCKVAASLQPLSALQRLLASSDSGEARRKPVNLKVSHPVTHAAAHAGLRRLFHACFILKSLFYLLSSAIVAEQAERSCPAPPALRHRSHRFDSVLKAASASTMEACGKTITPAGLRSVNLHTRSFCLPPTVFHRWRGDGGQRVAVGCFPMEHTGVFIGESCCLSLLSLSKATYLTPPLQRS